MTSTARTDVAYRASGPADAEAMEEIVAEGFAAYRGFLPGWSPPDRREELDGFRRRLAAPDTWCELAERDGAVIGTVVVIPGAEARRPTATDTAHLIALFVRATHHGAGVAVRLLADAISHARGCGFRSMRLFTPESHARARRFYEREGWTAVGQPFDDPEFGMALVEYRRPLG